MSEFVRERHKKLGGSKKKSLQPVSQVEDHLAGPKTEASHFNRGDVVLIVCVMSVLLLCVCRLVHRQYNGQQDCEMTYMYQWPQYKARVHS